MQHSPNYVHYRCQWQIIGPDSPGQYFPRDVFLKLMDTLNKAPVSADFDDFSYRENSCEMGKIRTGETRGKTGFSKLIFKDDQLTLTEEWAVITANEFEKKFLDILKSWFDYFPQTLVIIQRCWIRALLQPVNTVDSRAFLGDKVLRIGERMGEEFKEMPFGVGFNFGCNRGNKDIPLTIETKVSSWQNTPSVWAEIKGSQHMPKPINATSYDEAAKPFQECLKFFEKELIPLLNRFDTPEDEKKNGEIK
ncbi:MAG: hypothetical protein GY869_23755 [Planctomycetes bacterium]|nr:hypothetical protein [Planctomycetota bacterium]